MASSATYSSLRAYWREVRNRAWADTKAELDRTALFQTMGVAIAAGIWQVVLAGRLSLPDAGIAGLLGAITWSLILLAIRLVRAPMRLAQEQAEVIATLQDGYSELQLQLHAAERKLTDKEDRTQKCEFLIAARGHGELILKRMSYEDYGKTLFGAEHVVAYERWQESIATALKSHFTNYDYSHFHNEIGLTKPQPMGGAPMHIDKVAELLTYRLLRLGELIENYRDR